MEKVVVRLFADCKTKNQIASKSSEYQEWSIGNSKVGNFPLGRIADVLLSEYGIMRVVRVKQAGGEYKQPTVKIRMQPSRRFLKEEGVRNSDFNMTYK